MIKTLLPRFSPLIGSQWRTIKQLPTFSDSVKVSEHNQAGVLTLNRPKKLNALNLDMIRIIYTAMRKWHNTKSLVIIKSDLENTFCAGGDVLSLIASPKSRISMYLQEEYSLDYLISKYRIPFVALINGTTMGAGVGISVHGKYRVATEKTVFAMPETRIGLIPVVGCGYVLPRLPGQLGMYLGLTGDCLKGKDVLHAGVATHFCEFAHLADLEDALVSCVSCSEVDDTLSKYCPIDKSGNFSLQPQMHRINECFSGCSIEDIVHRLEQENSNFSQQCLKTLRAADPFSLKVTHHYLQTGRHLSLVECFKMDLRIESRRLEDVDFREGVRAMLIDRDMTPKWKHSSLKDVSKADMLSMFRPFEEFDRELQLSDVI